MPSLLLFINGDEIMKIYLRSYLLKSLFQLVLPIIITFVAAIAGASAFDLPPIPSFPTISSPGSTFYVNKDVGNNVNNGSATSPWKTIAYGVTQLRAGDTLIIKEATSPYAEAIDITNVGTSSNWITIQGAPGETVEVGGSSFDRPFDFRSASAYIYLKNIDIVGTSTYAIQLRGGCQHIVLDDIDIDATGGFNGLFIGTIYSTGANHIYIRNVEAYNASTQGFKTHARSEDVTFSGCTARDNGGDGFGGHLAWGSGETWENSGPPDDPLNVMRDLYFINCSSYSNGGEGFDIGLVKKIHLFKNCKAYNNSAGQGFKVWGDEVWLINCLAYDNYWTGINIKPLWENSNFYILHSTLVNNKTSQIRVKKENAGYTLKAGRVYMYNNILMSTPNDFWSSPYIVECEGMNGIIQEEDNNYFYSANDLVAIMLRYAARQTYYLSDLGIGKSWNNNTGLGANSFARTSEDNISDPGFISLAGNDFTLKDSSLAIDAGVSKGVTDDCIGVQRPQGDKVDIGAYEYRLLQASGPAPPNNLRIIQ
jgi:hypothetical protein